MTYTSGKHKDAYAEWDEAGRQAVWGWFEEDREESPWLIVKEVPVVVTFDRGADVTEAVGTQPISRSAGQLCSASGFRGRPRRAFGCSMP